MKIVFVSNYINHHQIPFCDALIENLGENDSFTFVQTDRMEDDRSRMGWGVKLPEYVLDVGSAPENMDRCRQLLMDSEVVIFGGSSDDGLIIPRLEKQRISGEPGGKITFRYSERVYREGQWKFITPRGLRKKYLDHTRYGKEPVFLLCAGGYVASDFALFGAYRGKMFKWGYFPPFKEYDTESLLENKGFEKNGPEKNGPEKNGKKVPYLLWVGRLLKLKHPELAVKTAAFLKGRGYDFHLDIIGEGPEKETTQELISQLELSDMVTLHGFKKPAEVREYMEKADVFLFTSDRNEGWGAVVNESMNSCCAVVAGSMIGAVPFLLENGVNGFVYLDGKDEDLFEKTERLVRDASLRKEMGKKAYETLLSDWNASEAAKRFLMLSRALLKGDEIPDFEKGPCSREIPGKERAVSRRSAGKGSQR